MASTQAASFSCEGSRAKFGWVLDWVTMWRMTWVLCMAWSSRLRIRLAHGEVVLGPLTRRRLGKEDVIVPGWFVSLSVRGWDGVVE